MNDFDKVKEILSSFIKIYKELLSVAQKEKMYLINIDIENLMKIIELKQYIGLEVKKFEDSLKEILHKHNVDNINEFLFFASKDNSVDEIRILNGMLRELLDKFNRESDINRVITQESASFYNSMVNMYIGFLKNQNENYNKDATIGITQRAISVKV